jgi:hypothetical protein
MISLTATCLCVCPKCNIALQTACRHSQRNSLTTADVAHLRILHGSSSTRWCRWSTRDSVTAATDLALRAFARYTSKVGELTEIWNHSVASYMCTVVALVLTLVVQQYQGAPSSRPYTSCYIGYCITKTTASTTTAATAAAAVATSSRCFVKVPLWCSAY